MASRKKSRSTFDGVVPGSNTIKGGNFKTSPRSQYRRWGEVANPQNTQCMSAVDHLTPP